MLNQNYSNNNLDCFEVEPLPGLPYLLTVCSPDPHGKWDWTLTNTITGDVLATSEAPTYHCFDAVDQATKFLVDMLETER
jgi:hypothetical protein